MSTKTQFPLSNNKGSTALIISLVFGLVMLAVGGYFGYTWYQNKLLQERIDKVVKVDKAAANLVEKLNADSLKGDFDPKKTSTYKTALNSMLDANKELDKLEIDKDLEDEVKACVDNTNKVVEVALKVVDVVERADKAKTEAELLGLRDELDSIDEKDLKASEVIKDCEKVSTSSKELVKDLEMKKY